jgi:mannitol/fructose-specific phosphotransferase system IIA component
VAEVLVPEAVVLAGAARTRDDAIDAKSAIRRTAISFVRYAEPVDWKGKPAEFVVGIAGAGDDHLTVLSRLAEVFMDEAEIARLRAATSADDVLAVLGDVRV